MLQQVQNHSPRKENPSDDRSKHSGKSTVGSKNLGQSSGEQEEPLPRILDETGDEPVVTSTGKQHGRRNTLEVSNNPKRDMSYSGRQNASRISNTPEQNKTYASSVKASTKQKDFRPRERLGMLEILEIGPHW